MSSPGSATPLAPLLLTAPRLITGLAAPNAVIQDAALLIRDGRIAAAGPAAAVRAAAPADAQPVAYPDATILPGLIDAHVHLTFRRGETSLEHVQRVSDERALLRGVHASRQILAAGVTTVRDCAARGCVAQSLRDAVRDGLIPGPRILASGPPITTTAGHLWPLGYEADDADQARAAVRRLVKEGADFVKVCATGGGMTPGSVISRAQYTAAELRAIVEDAHRLGRRVAAHVHGTEGIARAVAAGVDTLEHVSWVDPSGRGHAFDERVARQMAERGIVANIASNPPRQLVEHGRAAALTAADDPEPAAGDPHAQVERPHVPETAGIRPALARWEFARRMIALGVQVCFSTDSIYGTWDDGHDLSYLAQALVEAGDFPPLDVLRMLTAVPAQALGLDHEIGTLEPTKHADLVVIRGDPTQDIRCLHRVITIYQRGLSV